MYYITNKHFIVTKLKTNYSKNIILPWLLIIAYLCIGFIPNLSAVDKIAPQWLVMSILNTISITYLFIYRSFYSVFLKNIIINPLSLTYFGFIFWAGLSYLYAINSIEVLVNISRQANVFIMFLILAVLLISLTKKTQIISWIIFLILGVEVYFVLIDASLMIQATGEINSGMLKGVTANRNITAFSIAIKIPIILYLLNFLSKRFFKFLAILLVFLSFLCLTLIQSRASFIAVALIVFAQIFLSAYEFYLHKNKNYAYDILKVFLPLVFAVLLNQTYYASKGADALGRASTISLSTNDGSVNQRLRYYEDVLTHLRSNPILGVGLGNWKLKSIDYDSKDIVGYIVPYHAHSDFIQLGAELGLVGFLSYLSIFILVFFLGVKLITNSERINQEKKFIFYLLISLGVYSIDANLNFPIARPQVLVVWALIIAIIVGYYYQSSSKVKASKFSSVLYLIVGMLITIPSIYISNSVYKSLKGQMFLLRDFNSNQYNIPLSQIDQIVPNIPNITVTTIPINSVKARYYENAGDYKKALSLLNKGTKANPYLYYSEHLKSQIFLKMGKLDSAKFYAKKSFFGLPNNPAHAGNYVNIINQTNDEKSLEEAFELLTFKNNETNWSNYLIVASKFAPIGDKRFLDRAEFAIGMFPKNIDIKNAYKRIKIGIERINKAQDHSKTGLEFFNSGSYIEASKQFELAYNSDPTEYAYYENAATSNYLIGNFDKALKQIDVVINSMNPLNGKCEYIKALIFLRLGDQQGACPLLRKARDSGYSQANSVFSQNCQ